MIGLDLLLGVAGFAIVGGISWALARRYPRIALPIATAFSIRFVASVVHAYLAVIPGGEADAMTYERLAWSWAQDGLAGALAQFHGPTSDFYSVQLAVLYALTDRSPLMGQAVSVLAAMGVVVYTYVLARLLFGERAGVKAAWVVAVFPTLVLYSIFTRRESFIHLAVIAGLFHSARWGAKRRLSELGLAFLWFAAGMFYHTGLVLGIAGLGAIFIGRQLRRMPAQAVRGRFSPRLFLVALPLLIAAVALVASGARLQKLGSLQDLLDFQQFVALAEGRARSGAAYPAWMLPNRPIDLVWNVPARLVYFLFAPFPWDVRRAAHLQGLVDGLLYLGLVVLLWKQRATIRSDRGAMAAFQVVVPLVFAFAMSTGNFGNGMRHRVKFLPVIAALAAPLIPRPVLVRTRYRASVRPARPPSDPVGGDSVPLRS